MSKPIFYLLLVSCLFLSGCANWGRGEPLYHFSPRAPIPILEEETTLLP